MGKLVQVNFKKEENLLVEDFKQFVNSGAEYKFNGFLLQNNKMFAELLEIKDIRPIKKISEKKWEIKYTEDKYEDWGIDVLEVI